MRGNPVVCSGRFAGDRKTFPAHLPSSHRDRGCRCGRGGAAGRLRRRILLGREPGQRHLPGQGHRRAASRPTQRLGQTSLLQLGDPQQRQEDHPGADRDRLDRRQGGRRHPPCRSASAIPSLASPSQTGPSGCWRQPTRDWSAPPSPAAHDLQSQDLRLRPAQARRDHGSRLEAERGQGRPTTPSSTASTPASSGDREGEDRRRRRPGRLLRHRNLRRATGHRSHRQRRSRRSPEAAAAKRARRRIATAGFRG